jgi:hypothetical protein
MDTKWLIAIVIGNVIAAIVKELVGAFIKRLPKMMATLIGKLMPTVISILIKHWQRIDLVMTGVVALSQFGFAFWASQTPKPISGGVVFGVAFLIGFGFWYVREFEHKLLAYAKPN